jgi:hypothetical protein
VISDKQIRDLSNPYDILWDPTYKGVVGVYDSYRDVMMMTMLRRGETDLNTSDPTKITQAGDDLTAMSKATNPKINTNVAYIGISHNQLHVTQAWSGDMASAWGYMPRERRRRPRLLVPRQPHGNVDNDLITIPKTPRTQSWRICSSTTCRLKTRWTTSPGSATSLRPKIPRL